jgi:hypothetical protein
MIEPCDRNCMMRFPSTDHRETGDPSRPTPALTAWSFGLSCRWHICTRIAPLSSTSGFHIIVHSCSHTTLRLPQCCANTGLSMSDECFEGIILCMIVTTVVCIALHRTYHVGKCCGRCMHHCPNIFAFQRPLFCFLNTIFQSVVVTPYACYGNIVLVRIGWST